MSKKFLSALVALVISISSCKFVLASETTRLPILLYHHILTNEENTTQTDNQAIVSLEDFERQMAYLHDNGFYTITLDELQGFIYRGEPLPPKSVMITFDDGYYSNITRAYPVLKHYNQKATLFLISSYILDYQQEFNPDKFPFISLVTMNDVKDVFEYASHTYDMHRVNDACETTLATATREEIMEDVYKSFDLTDNNIAFAYPLGQYNDKVIDALWDSGIRMAMTVEDGYVTSNTDGMRLHRFVIYKSTPFSQFVNIVEGRCRYGY